VRTAYHDPYPIYDRNLWRWKSGFFLKKTQTNKQKKHAHIKSANTITYLWPKWQKSAKLIKTKQSGWSQLVYKGKLFSTKYGVLAPDPTSCPGVSESDERFECFGWGLFDVSVYAQISSYFQVRGAAVMVCTGQWLPFVNHDLEAMFAILKLEVVTTYGKCLYWIRKRSLLLGYRRLLDMYLALEEGKYQVC